MQLWVKLTGAYVEVVVFCGFTGALALSDVYE